MVSLGISIQASWQLAKSKSKPYTFPLQIGAGNVDEFRTRAIERLVLVAGVMLSEGTIGQEVSREGVGWRTSFASSGTKGTSSPPSLVPRARWWKTLDEAIETKAAIHMRFLTGDIDGIKEGNHELTGTDLLRGNERIVKSHDASLD